MDSDSKALKQLYQEITRNKGKPLNHWEVTALLEVHGLRDIDATEQYGCDSLFTLGSKMTAFIHDYEYDEIEFEREEIIPVVPRVTKNYIKGLAFALPMLLQILCTLVLGYAIWSSLTLEVATATAIAVGTFAALVVTGGMAQSIGRKGLFYLKMQEYVLTSKVTKRFYLAGMLGILLFGLLFFLFNLFFGYFPLKMFAIMFIFYLGLSMLFLNFSIFFVFESYFNILVFTMIGIIMVYIFYRALQFDLVPAQMTSLLLLNIIIFFAGFRKLNHLEKKDPEAEGTVIPQDSVLFTTVIPFYTYGTLYFLFLIMDRFIAWTVNTGNNPYIIWFNVKYEVGLDWALIALVFMMGITEVSIHEFLLRINKAIKQYNYDQIKSYNKRMLHFYYQFNALFFLFSIATIILTYLFIANLNHFTDAEYIEVFMQNPTPAIFLVASIGYIFLVNGLMNILFMFSLSRQQFALRAIGYGLIVNMVTGLILSRSLGYAWAAGGLLLGAMVFWYITHKNSIKMFNDLDYYFYSAY